MTPAHSVEISDEQLRLIVQLPDVSTAAQIDLDATSRTLDLSANQHLLNLTFSVPVDEDSCTAEFDKATQQLTLCFHRQLHVVSESTVAEDSKETAMETAAAAQRELDQVHAAHQQAVDQAAALETQLQQALAAAAAQQQMVVLRAELAEKQKQIQIQKASLKESSHTTDTHLACNSPQPWSDSPEIPLQMVALKLSLRDRLLGERVCSRWSAMLCAVRWRGTVDITSSILTKFIMRCNTASADLAQLIHRGELAEAQFGGEISVEDYSYSDQMSVRICAYNTRSGHGYFSHTNQTYATGIQIWPPVPVMCHHLLAYGRTLPLSGCRVLELGAGVGILGVVIAKLGASEVAITEISDVCRVVVDINVVLNQVQSLVHVAPLRYGKEFIDSYLAGDKASTNCGPGPQTHYPLIIGTDIVYTDSLIPPLFETVSLMLEQSPDARFLLGWIVRGVQTKELLEENAKEIGLDHQIIDCTPYLDLVYGKANTLFDVHAHERDNLKIWEFKWSQSMLSSFIQ